MTLFKHKKTGILYLIYDLIRDIHFLNHNERSGIYCEPYNTNNAETIVHLRYNPNVFNHKFNPVKFISENFVKVSPL